MKKSKKTPIVNIVWADVSTKELEKLKEEVELAVKDPNYTIIANYEINWNQIKINKKATCRLVWADDISDKEVNNLRDQVEMAIADPDFIIISNYEIHWEEIS